MSYIDDLVKLRYLAPMREAANSAIANVGTFKSKDIIKEFMDNLQTNPDGTSRPGGASGLDLSKPESIQKLVGMENGTLAKLIEQAGGKMNTAEVAGVQSISDRILRGMTVGSDMTYKAGQTDIGEKNAAVNAREATVKEGALASENRLRNAQAGYYNRMPKETASMYASMSKKQLDEIENLVSVTMKSEDPDIMSVGKGALVDAIRQNPLSPFQGFKDTIKSRFPKLSASQIDEKANKLFNTLAPDYKTRQQEELQQRKTEKNVNVVNAIQKQIDEDPFTLEKLAGDIKKQYDDSGATITDASARDKARTQIIHQKLTELGKYDPDLMPDDVRDNDPNNMRHLVSPVNIQPQQRTAPNLSIGAGTTGTKMTGELGQVPEWFKPYIKSEKK
jgi:hypothetical protein